MMAIVMRGRRKRAPGSTPATRRGRRAAGPRGPRAPRFLRFLGAAGLVPGFALAFYSLTQPWAKARVVLVLGITRSAGATMLVIAALAAALVVGIGLALHGGRPRTTGLVHLAMGVLLALVSWKAYLMIRAASVSALFVPIASVHRGPGWFTFTLGAALLVLLGLLEVALADRFTRRYRRGKVASAATAAQEPASV